MNSAQNSFLIQPVQIAKASRLQHIKNFFKDSPKNSVKELGLLPVTQIEIDQTQHELGTIIADEIDDGDDKAWQIRGFRQDNDDYSYGRLLGI